jgi:hypothetical protein
VRYQHRDFVSDAAGEVLVPGLAGRGENVHQLGKIVRRLPVSRRFARILTEIVLPSTCSQNSLSVMALEVVSILRRKSLSARIPAASPQSRTVGPPLNVLEYAERNAMRRRPPTGFFNL